MTPKNIQSGFQATGMWPIQTTEEWLSDNKAKRQIRTGTKQNDKEIGTELTIMLNKQQMSPSLDALLLAGQEKPVWKRPSLPPVPKKSSKQTRSSTKYKTNELKALARTLNTPKRQKLLAKVEREEKQKIKEKMDRKKQKAFKKVEKERTRKVKQAERRRKQRLKNKQ